MCTMLYFLFNLLLITTSVISSVVKPFDLVDEAQEQLDQLKNLIQADISVAHEDVEALSEDFVAYADNALNVGNSLFEQAVQTINQHLATLENLGQSAGVDIAHCTDSRVEVLERMPDTYINEMIQCNGYVRQEAFAVGMDAIYLIDIIFNKIEDLAWQLGRCKGDLLCISPLLSEIESYKVSMPQTIKTEVGYAESLYNNLIPSIEACSVNNIASYVAEADSIIVEISTCIDQIIG